MAAGKIKSLAKDTAIYGMSSILGRSLNWLLTLLYVYIFTNPEEFGKVAHLYGYTALFMVLLTYGMETGFFRFMNKENEKKGNVYSTSLISLAFTSIVFVFLCFMFINPISELIKYANHTHILIMVLVVATDAFITIPYAKLRYDKRPMRFMLVRMVFIISNIFFNLFFLVACPFIYEYMPSLISWFYNPHYGIGYIFVANLLSTFISLLMLAPTFKDIKFVFDSQLLKRMLLYSYPLLILGVSGVTSHTVVPLLYPHLNIDNADYQMGVYGACIKITLIIAMFTQAFRYAYEPFIFAQDKEKRDTETYAQAMKYYIIFALLIFLAVIFYFDIIKYFVSEEYYVGLIIVPIAMMGEICFGIYFNLSIWYKLTDKTSWGAILSILGCVITVLINIIFVPIYGFIASAWAVFICNFIIMFISYFLGQKYFPINYHLKTIAFYLTITILLYLAGTMIPIDNQYLRLIYRSLLLMVFAGVIIKRDLPLNQIPIINKYLKNK